MVFKTRNWTVKWTESKRSFDIKVDGPNFNNKCQGWIKWPSTLSNEGHLSLKRSSNNFLGCSFLIKTVHFQATVPFRGLPSNLDSGNWQNHCWKCLFSALICQNVVMIYLRFFFNFLSTLFCFRLSHGVSKLYSKAVPIWFQNDFITTF